MNARTCLLCGKALSRIWVGAGEDFCSREHRNQYRLRKGMDRLLEASKVANLMRRREQPKPITPTLQAGNSAQRLQDSPAIRFAARGLAPIYPASKWAPPVSTPDSQGWIKWYRTALLESTPREYGILRGQVAVNGGASGNGAASGQTYRVVLGKGSRKIDPPGAACLERTRRLRPLRLTGRHGNALRVSAGAGFRLPSKRGRHFPTPRHPIAGMRWPDRPMRRALRTLDRPMAAKLQQTSFPLREALNPDAPRPALGAGMPFPGILAAGRRTAADGKILAPRPWGALWSKTESTMPPPIRHSGQERAAAPLALVPQKPAYGTAAKQLGLVAWTQLDPGFAHPAPASSAERAPSPARTRMEERFDSGWRDWVGGVDDWIVDAAGVRTGAPALFRPSLDMRDYEMEFLARIENRSVVWLFRASNFSEYYVASLGLTARGGYEFRRATVMGGVRGPDVVVPLRKAPKAKTAVTVRLRAAGNEFGVWVDGQAIENWSETSLPLGGIGFMGAPDDRARIYWVRISPVGGPPKELPKR